LIPEKNKLQKQSTKAYLLLLSFALFHLFSNAQTSLNAVQYDTIKRIEILSANSLRQITISHSTVLETLAGNAVIRQGNTTLSGDSIVLDKTLGIAEVFGHVHINNGDTVNTYSGYLKYLGNEQVAYLSDQVTLTDSKATLTTNNLTYNIKTGISTYENGGSVTTGKTSLTSNSGTYFSGSKDALFTGNVKLTDPKYKMQSDSLRYNTALKKAFFIAPTHIISENGIVDTKSGDYNLETGEAHFADQTVFKDGPRTISGNRVQVLDKNQTIQIEENGRFADAENKIIVTGNHLFINKKNNSFLATQKPVIILYENNDSTYITADTLFSAKRLLDSNEIDYRNRIDSNSYINKKGKSTSAKDSLSYFKGFHHVKIYNDSLQAICDSMYFTSLDSTFKLMQSPVCWNGPTQLSGDTITVFTTNKKPRQIHVNQRAMLINSTTDGLFNQISGKTMTGYFVNGEIDYIRNKGNPAESIYYPQDDDSAYIGMNKSKGDIIDIFFMKKQVQKIKFINEVEGTLYPMRQIPENMNRLMNFNWQIDKKPKSKLEIFE